jgi:hypothetical protein
MGEVEHDVLAFMTFARGALASDLQHQSAGETQRGSQATHCRGAADSYVASVAKFALKWDDVGFLGALFDKYLVRVETPGVLPMTSSRLSLQNAFGAFKRVRVFCDYDTRTKKVRGVRILDQ